MHCSSINRRSQVVRDRLWISAGTALALSAIWAVPGCQSPFNSSSPPSLQQTVEAAIARELSRGSETPEQAAATTPDEASSTTSDDYPQLTTTRPASPVEQALQGRREELDRLTPWGARGEIEPKVDLGPDLRGLPQQRITITLEQAIGVAIERNLAIQAVRLLPAIRAEDVIEAEAIFDTLLFGSIEYGKVDEPNAVTVIGGVPLGTPSTQSNSWRFETGVSQRFTTGAVGTISTDLTRFENENSGISFSPDPAYASAVRLGITQPLMRGFGESVNTAVIRLTRNDERRSIEDVRIALLRLADDTEAAYWNLVQAWADLGIAEWLVDQGIGVRDVLKQRLDLQFDVSVAEYSDAVARVEQRRADIVRAQRAVRFASDRLKELMNDRDITLASETVLYPANELSDQPISYNLREALLTAVDNRPEIARAALAIEDSSIRIAVTDNNRLPVLDLAAQMSFLGLDDTAGGSYDELSDADFIDYVLGLLFEYPLGNHAADAAYRRSRLERSAAIIAYQQQVQNVVLDVKSALRDVVTNYQLIGATRSFRIAQAENLRALLVEEETIAGLTPEFLNLKFERQDGLAIARRQEIDAVASFDKAVSSLYRAMGIGLSVKNIKVELVDDHPPVDAGLWGEDAADWPR
jgi:outer membrane protein TolC